MVFQVVMRLKVDPTISSFIFCVLHLANMRVYTVYNSPRSCQSDRDPSDMSMRIINGSWEGYHRTMGLVLGSSFNTEIYIIIVYVGVGGGGGLREW